MSNLFSPARRIRTLTRQYAAMLVLASCGALWTSASAAAVDLSRRVQFDISPQPLSTALLRFSEQAAVQLAAPSTLLGGLQTDGVRGEHSMSAALEVLLRGTGLTFQALDERTVAIHLTTNSSSKQTTSQARNGKATGTTNDSVITLAQGDTLPGSAGAIERTKQKDVRGDTHNDAAELGDLVVTGSYIRGVTPDSSPRITYDRKQIERFGVSTVEQFLRKLPQNFASVDSNTFLSLQTTRNVSRGSAVNLRGLGAGSTLVLLNGNRMAPAGEDGSFVDVSMIPLSAVERVEVLTDGASAIYGADAVAGVVNFVLRRDFDGAESSIRYGDTTSGGASEFGLSQLLGNVWNDGSAMLVYDYVEQDGLRSDQRDFIPPNRNNGVVQLLPQQRRHSVFVTGRQDLTASVDAFGDAFYGNRKFEQDDSIPLGLIEHWEGETTQVGAVVGVGRDFLGGWRASAISNYAREEEDGERELEGVRTQDPGTRSELMSVDLRADGPIFSTAGGHARASMGLGARREEFDDFATERSAGQGLRRDVASLYGELFTPLVSETNARSWANRIELSLAVRHDDYDDLGSSTDPKVGLLWSPIRGLALRGTYSTSFRVPPLAQLSNASREYFLFPFADPNAPDGVTNTLLLSAPGNPELDPEEAESFTLGFDIRPPRVPGLSISATYFNVDYSNRIAGPPVVGSPFDIFFQTDVLAPFMDLSPDLAAVQEDIDRGATFTDFLGIGFANSEAIFDFRLKNIAVTRTSGAELSLEHEFDSAVGHFGVFLTGSYLFDLDFQPTSATPAAELVNKTFNPMDLRLRTGLTWSSRAFTSILAVNYSDEYDNNLLDTPGRVKDWTTADWQLTYSTPERNPSSFFSGMTFTVNVQNLTNEDPPTLPSNGELFYDFGYDVTNAGPRGRLISATITKQW